MERERQAKFEKEEEEKRKKEEFEDQWKAKKQ